MTNIFYVWFLEFGFLKIWRGGLVVKNLLFNIGNVGWIPGSGGSLGEGNGNPLQYSFFFMFTPVFLPGESHGQREEPGGLPSMGSQRVGHDRVTEHRCRHVSSKTLIFSPDLYIQWSGLNYPTLQEGFFFFLQNFPVHPLVQCSELIMPIKITLFRDCNGPSSLGS